MVKKTAIFSNVTTLGQVNETLHKDAGEGGCARRGYEQVCQGDVNFFCQVCDG